MKVFETIKETKDHLYNKRQKENSIGFVPTMGCLHAGHTSLLQQAKKENDILVCSIFVNPKQFDNPEDLKKYPRNFEKDLDILSNYDCDIVFTPSVEEMYPEPVNEVYHFGELEDTMEGFYRKGHFNGVAIVVKRLLEIIQPDRAYFGKKDYQQLLVVKQLVKKTNLPVEIVPSDTVREADGLAMSSRNQKLTPQQRKDAATIYKALCKVKELYPKKSIAELKEMITYEINAKPTLQTEYIEIVNPENLKPLKPDQPDQNAIACIAVYAGKTRLIDNMLLNE